MASDNHKRYLGCDLVCSIKSASGSGTLGCGYLNNNRETVEWRGKVEQVKAKFCSLSRYCNNALSATYTDCQNGFASLTYTRYACGTTRCVGSPAFGGAQMSISLVSCPLIQHKKFRKLLDPETIFTERNGTTQYPAIKLVSEFVAINQEENKMRYICLHNTLSAYDNCENGYPLQYAVRTMAGQDSFLQSQATASVSDAYRFANAASFSPDAFSCAGTIVASIGDKARNHNAQLVFAESDNEWNWLYAGANISVGADGSGTTSYTYNGLSVRDGGCWDKCIYGKERTSGQGGQN